MKFIFTESEDIIQNPTTRVQPGDVCTLINRKGERNVFIAVSAPVNIIKCSLKCDLSTDGNYRPHNCASYDLQCEARMAFNSITKALEGLCRS